MKAILSMVIVRVFVNILVTVIGDNTDDNDMLLVIVILRYLSTLYFMLMVTILMTMID